MALRPLSSQNMKKDEKATPRIGDFVVTNDNYKVANEKGSLIVKQDFFGFIVQKIKEGGKIKYGIRFGAGLPWTNDLNGLLSDKFGDYLLESEFEIDN
jgi:hypothetical protein